MPLHVGLASQDEDLQFLGGRFRGVGGSGPGHRHKQAEKQQAAGLRRGG